MELLLAEIDVAEAWKLLFGAGGSVAALIFGLKWLEKDRNKIVSALDKERQERIDLIIADINECKEDRAKIHDELDGLRESNDKVRDESIAMASMFHKEIEQFRDTLNSLVKRLEQVTHR